MVPREAARTIATNAHNRLSDLSILASNFVSSLSILVSSLSSFFSTSVRRVLIVLISPLISPNPSRISSRIPVRRSLSSVSVAWVMVHVGIGIAFCLIEALSNISIFLTVVLIDSLE
jgi:hypothetical protein